MIEGQPQKNLRELTQIQSNFFSLKISQNFIFTRHRLQIRKIYLIYRVTRIGWDILLWEIKWKIRFHKSLLGRQEWFRIDLKAKLLNQII